MDYTWLWLLGGGVLVGIINAVAGGGALLTYPLLLSLGMPPVNANATLAMSSWPGGLASAFGYRDHLRRLPRRFYWLLIPCLLGGLIGGVLLSRTTGAQFAAIVPWFIFLAVGLLIFQPHIHTLLHSRRYLKLKKHHKIALYSLVAAGLLVVAVYGGYFGAGFGIIMLAFLGLTELRDIQQLNGLKNLASVVINLACCSLFILFGYIDWAIFAWLAAGTICGGWFGAHFGAKLPAHIIRSAIIIIGIIVAFSLLIKG